MGAQLSDHGITSRVLENSGGTTVKIQADLVVVRQDAESDGEVVVGGIVAKHHAAALTPAAQSAPQGAVAATATAVGAIPRATATTAQRGAGTDIQNVHRTQSMTGGVVVDEDDQEDTSTRPHLLKTRALAHAATAAGRGTGGTIAAAPEAPVAGAAAPALGPGDAATAAAVALPVALHPPLKAPHTGMG